MTRDETSLVDAFDADDDAPRASLDRGGRRDDAETRVDVRGVVARRRASTSARARVVDG